MAKGLSVEEKRTKLLELFHETKDFYQLKELEKLAPKMKGIVFWSFPSQQGAMLQNRLNATKEVQATNEAQLKEITDAIEKEKSSRQDNDERKESLDTLTELKRQVCKLDEELTAYGACDPVKLEETRRAITLAKEAALRWTDNFGILLSHFTRQNGAPAEDVRKYLGVEDEYEDIY